MSSGCCLLCGHCSDEVIAEMMDCKCKCHGGIYLNWLKEAICVLGVDIMNPKRLTIVPVSVMANLKTYLNP